MQRILMKINVKFNTKLYLFNHILETYIYSVEHIRKLQVSQKKLIIHQNKCYTFIIIYSQSQIRRYPIHNQSKIQENQYYQVI